VKNGETKFHHFFINIYLMIKKWDTFNEEIDYNQLDDNQKQFIDTLNDEKGKYLLIILLKGNEDDMNLLSEQINDFHDIHPDMTRVKVPYTLFYGVDWWLNNGHTMLGLRNIFKEEADNLGLRVKILTHMISEKDMELDRDLPPKYRIDVDAAFKKMNGIN
jgi:hypothetical protein